MNISFEKVIGKDEEGNEITEKKTYVVDHLKARMVRRAIELTDGINLNNMKPETLDKMVNYIVEVYRNQFTIDDIYDGIDSDKLMPTILNCLNDVVGTMSAKLEQFPKNA